MLAALCSRKAGSRLQYAAENFGSGPIPGSPAAQGGHMSYHGTGRQFDSTPENPYGAFEDSKIGEGEGSQMMGWGHYLAEHQETAGSYARQQALLNYGDLGEDRGVVYNTHVDDAHVNNMLDADKPMSEQPAVLAKIDDSVRGRLEKLAAKGGQDLESLNGNEFRQLIERGFRTGDVLPLDAPPKNIPKATSQYLSNRGIPGIKYLDRGSRMTGQGTRNLVVFKGKHITITEQEK